MSKYKLFIGVDVGLDGALVALNAQLKVHKVIRMPTVAKRGNPSIKSKIDASRLADELLLAIAESEAQTNSEVIVFIEEPPTFIGGHMLTPQLSLHHSCGIIEGVIACFPGMPEPHFVPVQKWKAQYDIKKGKKKIPGKEQKKNAIELALHLNPELGPLKMQDADIAEAALVARYGIKYIIGATAT